MKRALIISTFLAMAACSDSDSGGKAKVSLSLQPVLSGGAVSANSISSTTGSSVHSRAILFNDINPRVAVAEDCSAVNSYPAYKAAYGASGAPDEMALYLKSISLSTSESGSSATLFESQDPDGDKITISNANGGTISLAALSAAIAAETIEDDDGNTIEAEISTGTFNQLSVVFRNEADIKGCIEQDWDATPAGTVGESGNTCIEASEACNILTAGSYKVCTGAAEDSVTSNAITIFDLVTEAGEAAADSVTNQAQFDDYVGTTAAETQVNLNIRDTDENFTRLADATFNLDVPPVTIEDGDSINLTLAFDMNLLLRFEGNTRYQRGGSDDDGDFHPLGNVMEDMNDSKDLDAAYFHTSYLPDVMAVYLGEPGAVEGYEVTSCYQFNNNGTLVDGDYRTVKSWMTMIFDAAGDLVTGIATPKDDAGMVIVKGGVNKLDATERPSIKNSDGSYDLKFGEEVYSGAINSWSRISTVGDVAEVAEEDIEQTVRSSVDIDNRQVPTWHYERKL